VEYNAAADEVVPIANWIVSPETKKYPMVAFNISSDRLGTPKGPMGYGLTVRYSEFEKGINFPFGVNFQLAKHLSLMPLNDGRKTHLMLSYTQPHYSVSLMYIWFKYPGISISHGF